MSYVSDLSGQIYIYIIMHAVRMCVHTRYVYAYQCTINKRADITIMVSKRDIDEHVRTTIGGKWATFDQMQMVTFKLLDSDIIHTDLETMQRSKYSFASNKYKE